MATAVVTGLYFFAFAALFALLARKVFGRRGRWSPGAAASGSMHEMLSEDKRKAIEIILEERAEYTDPETKDGDLPQLEQVEPPNPSAKND